MRRSRCAHLLSVGECVKMPNFETVMATWDNPCPIYRYKSGRELFHERSIVIYIISLSRSLSSFPTDKIWKCGRIHIHVSLLWYYYSHVIVLYLAHFPITVVCRVLCTVFTLIAVALLPALVGGNATLGLCQKLNARNTCTILTTMRYRVVCPKIIYLSQEIF